VPTPATTVEPVTPVTPATETYAAQLYASAEAAMKRHNERAARVALQKIVDLVPETLTAATALLDLARLAAGSGEREAALGFLDRLDKHPHRAALAAPAASLRASLAATTPTTSP
jgi:outer membrane protein assembly factor BamD (BamD/ComL family)